MNDSILHTRVVVRSANEMRALQRGPSRSRSERRLWAADTNSPGQYLKFEK
ncbi:MAG TPA: hypothetical protein PLY87_15180 [Planctomycetaceae bacterium]|nr:hypothetical protein [Planctomycetaceae bacterium]HQZ66431.1 hypothetical protein [Planctomycetaceae bacterium]